ncbi:MAG TPA: NAD(P)-binding domain-containing protein [Kofleriaceae bacterium]|jgi:3-hydroxyisobutyrate dehydrogenase
MITVLGTGLLGSGFVKALRTKGETVHVWNRTASRAQALAETGAVPFTDAHEAIAGASRIHIVVSDDAAVDSVLVAAKPPAGALVIDHSTTSTAGALDRTARAKAAGYTYLHAPVFMGPGNAAESTGTMMVSGDREVCARVTPLLAPMTGKLADLGERVDAAASYKLVGNLMLMGLGAMFIDMINLGGAMGLSPVDVGKLFEFFNPGSQLPNRFKRIAEAAWNEPPSWELAMARKDALLMQAEVKKAKRTLEMLPGVLARMETQVAAGNGNKDWTVIASDLVSK